MDERLYFALQVAQQALRQRVDRECVARVGLTSAQAALLFYVAQHEGCASGELARGLQLKPAAVTGLVTRTEKTGCIRRETSPDDARANELYLTAKGQKKLADIRRLNESFNQQLRAGFSPLEIATVLRFLAHARELALEQEP